MFGKCKKCCKIVKGCLIRIFLFWNCFYYIVGIWGYKYKVIDVEEMIIIVK